MYMYSTTWVFSMVCCLQCQKDNKRRMEKLRKRKLDSVIRARVAQKCKRTEEQQKRYMYIFCNLLLVPGAYLASKAGSISSCWYIMMLLCCLQESMGKDATHCSFLWRR